MRAGAARAARGAGKLFANILFVPLVRRETSLNQDRVVAAGPGTDDYQYFGNRC